MKRLFYSSCAILIAMVFAISCTKDNENQVKETTPFAKISVISNENYEKTIEPSLSSVSRGEVENYTVPSIKLTASVDITDDQDTRDYFIVPVSVDRIKASGLNTIAYISNYLISFSYPLQAPESVEMFKDSGIIANGDLAESENLYDLFPILPHEKQYIVCIPIENNALIFTEAAISSAITMARLFDLEDIDEPTTQLGCTINAENVEAYSCDIKITDLEQQKTYVFSTMKTSIFNTLSEKEIFLRSAEAVNCNGTVYGDALYTYFRDVPSVNISYFNTSYYEKITFDSDNTEYTMYIFEIDDEDSMITSKITSKTFTTAEDDTVIEGSLKEFTDPTTDEYKLSIGVDAGDFNGIYAVGHLDKYTIQQLGYSDNIEGFVSFYISTMAGCDFSEANEELNLYTGNCQFTDAGTKLLPESEYIVFAVGVSAKGEIASNIITYEYTTDDLADDFKIEMEITRYTDTFASYNITPSEQGIYYYYYLFESDSIEDMSDAQIASELLEEDYNRDNESREGNSTALQPSTDYTLVAIVLNANKELISDVYKCNLTTESEVN